MALCVELALEEAIANYGSYVVLKRRPSYWAGVNFGHMFCNWVPEGDTRLRWLNVSLQAHASYIIQTFIHLTWLVTDLRQSATKIV